MLTASQTFSWGASHIQRVTSGKLGEDHCCGLFGVVEPTLARQLGNHKLTMNTQDNVDSKPNVLLGCTTHSKGASSLQKSWFLSNWAFIHLFSLSQNHQTELLTGGQLCCSHWCHATCGLCDFWVHFCQFSPAFFFQWWDFILTRLMSSVLGLLSVIQWSFWQAWDSCVSANHTMQQMDCWWKTVKVAKESHSRMNIATSHGKATQNWAAARNSPHLCH